MPIIRTTTTTATATATTTTATTTVGQYNNSLAKGYLSIYLWWHSFGWRREEGGLNCIEPALGGSAYKKLRTPALVRFLCFKTRGITAGRTMNLSSYHTFLLEQLELFAASAEAWRNLPTEEKEQYNRDYILAKEKEIACM